MPAVAVAGREDDVESYFDKYQVSGTTPVVLMFDIDNFKRVNDELGHEIGDRVLVSVTAKVKDALDPLDSIIRWGGDEFICLIHETAEERIVSRIRKIQDTIREIFH